MAEKEVRLFDQIIRDKDKGIVYETKVKPEEEKQVKEQFEEYLFEGRKRKTEITKQYYECITRIHPLDIDKLAHLKEELKAVDILTQTAKDIYEELFGEKM